MRPQVVEKLTRIFSMMPGIGLRQASRFAYWLVDADKSLVEGLKLALDELKSVKRCDTCFRAYSGQNSCSICLDGLRDDSKVAVVEKDTDLEAMEKSGIYDGRYHVLGGLLSVLDAQSRDRLRLKEIFSRIKKDGSIREVILALSVTPEGEFSSRYIEKILEPLASSGREIKITRLGRGLSSGAELEYLNKETLKNALENRK
ncbi:MAG: recombination protein RecR [Candidatus Niyogibacteria bacterium]|nr:MAG: recombination protein RecR [Candidatus Niyogibacteria bacterium]